MRVKCPCCYNEYALEAAVADDASREFDRLLAGQPREVSWPLVAYVGLWRSKTRALSWERAVRIAREVLELTEDSASLGLALSETVEALRGKQEQQGAWQPLSSHHYLRRVLETVASRPAPAPVEKPLEPVEPVESAGQSGGGAPKSATRIHLERLTNRRGQQ